MIVLLLSILTSSLLFAIFKLFNKYKVDNLSAIIINYLVAFLVGCFVEQSLIVPQSIEFPWFYSALAMGFLFISLFTLMANTTISHGVTITVLANKMSLVIPVVLAFLFIGEQINWIQFVGISTALVGIVLTIMKPNQKLNLAHLKYPIILFVGSGILDFGLKLNQLYLLGSSSFYSFVSIVFLSAFSIGICYALITKKFKFNKKNLIAGIALGIPNFFSIIFIIKALNIESMDSTVIFPINNSGILLVSSFLGYLFFKEKMNIKNWVGIFCCLGGIFLIAFNS